MCIIGIKQPYVEHWTIVVLFLQDARNSGSNREIVVLNMYMLQIIFNRKMIMIIFQINLEIKIYFIVLLLSVIIHIFLFYSF